MIELVSEETPEGSNRVAVECSTIKYFVISPILLRPRVGMVSEHLSDSDTMSEQYRSTSPTPTQCRSSIGAPLRLRYCSDMVSEKYRSTSPTPILCRSCVGPTWFCSETSPTSFQRARLGPTSFRHRGSVVRSLHGTGRRWTLHWRATGRARRSRVIQSRSQR